MPLPTIPCTGYLVVTAITDNAGRTSYQHSPIYRTEAEALSVCARGMRPLKVWERSFARMVRECATALPAIDAEAMIAEAEINCGAGADRRAAA